MIFSYHNSQNNPFPSVQSHQTDLQHKKGSKAFLSLFINLFISYFTCKLATENNLKWVFKQLNLLSSKTDRRVRNRQTVCVCVCVCVFLSHLHIYRSKTVISCVFLSLYLTEISEFICGFKSYVVSVHLQLLSNRKEHKTWHDVASVYYRIAFLLYITLIIFSSSLFLVRNIW